MAIILIIDDEPAMRASLRRLLVGAGHSVLETADGHKGLEIYEIGAADIVITDLVMPVKDGVATVKEILERDPAAKILVVSGVSSAGRGPALLAQLPPGVRVLSKPYSNEDVVRAVEELLGGDT